MRALVIRIGFIIIFALFACFGFFIVSIGEGYLNVLLTKAFPSQDLSNIPYLIPIGYLYIAVFITISAIISLCLGIDSKVIPHSHISRVIVQHKILIIVDGSVFEKISIKWADVALRYIKHKAIRNFYGIQLKEDIYIKYQKEGPVTTEDITSVEEIIEPEEQKFEMGDAEDAKDLKEIKEI